MSSNQLEANQPSLFPYNDIDADTITYLKQNAQETRVLLKRTSEDIMQIGKNLLEAKARLPHGQFTPWVKAELGISQSTSWRFMQVAQGKEIGPAKAAAFISAPKDQAETYKDLMSQVPDMPEFHALTKMIPAMQPREYASLVESIRQRGLISPIVIHKGKIIDGRMRYLACRDAGVLPQFIQYNGDDSDQAIVKYLSSMNLIRSHWTEDQIAIITVRAMELEEKLNQKRETKQKAFTVNDLEGESFFAASTKLMEMVQENDILRLDTAEEDEQMHALAKIVFGLANKEIKEAMTAQDLAALKALHDRCLELQNMFAERSIRLSQIIGKLVQELEQEGVEIG